MLPVGPPPSVDSHLTRAYRERAEKRHLRRPGDPQLVEVPIPGPSGARVVHLVNDALSNQTEDTICAHR